jgi:lysozyme
VWGVDVSWWQGSKIDWIAVRRAGAGFAFLRASCGITPDSTYVRNWREAGQQRITRGAYHYLEAHHDPLKQADLFAAQLRQGPADGDDGAVPAAAPTDDGGSGSSIVGRPSSLIWLDVEDDALTDAQVHAFCEHLQATYHLQPGIYTSRHKAQRIKLGPWAGSLPLWVADWRKEPKPAIPEPWSLRAKGAQGTDNWAYWQHTSSGHVPGITGRVDLSWKADPKGA